MTDENQDADPTSDSALSSEDDVASEDGQNEADADGDSKDGSSFVDEVEAITGKEFPSEEAARKAVEDTFSHVGKQKEQVKDEVKKEENFVTEDEFRTELFFERNPDHQENREIIEALADKYDAEPSDVVEMDAYQKVRGGSESQNDSEQEDKVMDSDSRRSASTSSADETFEKAKESGSTEDWAKVLQARREE
jgi:predicted lactoylglutathione lyase